MLVWPLVGRGEALLCRLVVGGWGVVLYRMVFSLGLIHIRTFWLDEVKMAGLSIGHGRHVAIRVDEQTVPVSVLP